PSGIFAFYFVEDLETKAEYQRSIWARSTDNGETIVCSEGEVPDWPFAFETNFGKADKSHFVQAIPTIVEGVVIDYRIYINGAPLSGPGLTISVEDFNKYNNYNEETGKFDGCYLGFVSSYTSLLQLSFPTDDRYTGSIDGNFSYTENYKGYDNVTLGQLGRANSTYQVNLLNGVGFWLDGLTANETVDFVRMGFGSDLWKVRETNWLPEAVINPSLSFMNVDGKLAVSVYDGETIGEYVTLDAAINDRHTVKVSPVTVEEETVYKFYVDGFEISGFSMTEAEFAAINNANAGAYMGLYANESAALYQVGEEGRIPTDKAFVDVLGYNGYTETENGYNVNLASWGYVKSTWTVDLRKGVSFKIDANAVWTALKLSGTYLNFDMNVNNEGAPFVMFANYGGKLLVSVQKIPGSVGESNKMLTELDATAEHILWAKPVTVDGVTVYEFYVDDVKIDGNLDELFGVFAVSEENFKLMNGYNEVTGEYDGAYLGVHSNGPSSTDIAAATAAPALNYGDADGNGEIGIEDLVVMRKYLLGFDLADAAFDVTLADANNDGRLNILDFICIKNLIP
ncbi:MAG: dockerin type I repeat-containing protein, partial [Clostridia bacterium]|nr:dockerin type I repeat-containing protein [Clostridia bacterium]